MRTFVISLGGSVIVPDGVDSAFLAQLRGALFGFLDSDPDSRLILVTGGGKLARRYQDALKATDSGFTPDTLDMIGIRATHLNAELVRAIMGCADPVVVNPMAEKVEFSGRILVAGGWKPGFSTDTDSVYLADRFGSKLVLNLSNTDRVYTADPKKDSSAKPIDRISWKDYISKISGSTWNPGANVPFDPVASAFAAEHSISVICADGRNIGNTLAILRGEIYIGTLID